MREITNVTIKDEGRNKIVNVSYREGENDILRCDATCASVIANLAVALNQSNQRTADSIRRKTQDSNINASNSLPTVVDTEFMRLVRAVCPKYNEDVRDADPRLVALDVLRHAPAEAYSSVIMKPLSELQLSEAIDVLTQVGDYMKLNNVEPNPFTEEDKLTQLNAGISNFWNKK